MKHIRKKERKQLPWLLRRGTHSLDSDLLGAFQVPKTFQAPRLQQGSQQTNTSTSMGSGVGRQEVKVRRVGDTVCQGVLRAMKNSKAEGKTGKSERWT